ncbi:hypothetical protein DWV63_03540 [Enterococcus durans]|nr:hypothetical protein DWV63_03540 [Enterococcus durans]
MEQSDLFTTSIKRCSRSCPLAINPKNSKYEKLFRVFHLYCSGQSASFTTSIKRCSKANSLK